MKNRKSKIGNWKLKIENGFTLIELLVVISIVVLLIGILVPSLRGAIRAAKNLKQKSHFHAIDISVEFFRDDYDNYPDSAVLPSITASSDLICGAHHLVEAAIGRDLKGFDPKSTWYVHVDQSDTEIYASSAKGSTAEEIEASKNRREGPYLELKKDMGVYTIDEIYSGNIGGIYSSLAGPTVSVITDVFNKTKITLKNDTMIKSGPPILYYKADRSSKLWPIMTGPEPVPGPQADKVDQYIYNYKDNDAIVQLNSMRDISLEHELDKDDGDKFYKMLNNKKLPYPGPYNPNTYILISAGWDGIYGTMDDVTNFN